MPFLFETSCLTAGSLSPSFSSFVFFPPEVHWEGIPLFEVNLKKMAFISFRTPAEDI